MVVLRTAPVIFAGKGGAVPLLSLALQSNLNEEHFETSKFSQGLRVDLLVRAVH